MPLFLLFLAVPLIEIALFIQVGGLIGLWPTLAIVVLTAIAGTWMIREQGVREIGRLRRSCEELRDPTEPLASGAMILFAGALLLTPGFFTDACGFALLLPPVRSAVFRWIRARVKIQRFQMGTSGQPRTDRQPDNGDPDVIDVDYEDVTPPRRPTHGASGWTRH